MEIVDAIIEELYFFKDVMMKFISNFLKTYSNYLLIFLHIAMIISFLYIPNHQDRKCYVSEMNLKCTIADGDFKRKDAELAIHYLRNYNHSIDWIEDELKSFGLDVYKHKFEINQKNQIGTNIYSIISSKNG